jgi:putative endonuclease
MDATKHFVYVLQSESQPWRYYTGLTANVQARLRKHNEGHSPHTASGAPWRVIVVLEFADEKHAVAFEKYLKSGSGCAFSKRHFR